VWFFLCGALYLVYVKDLTLSQLQNLKLDHSSVLEVGLENLGTSSAEVSPFHSGKPTAHMLVT